MTAAPKTKRWKLNGLQKGMILGLLLGSVFLMPLTMLALDAMQRDTDRIIARCQEIATKHAADLVACGETSGQRDAKREAARERKERTRIEKAALAKLGDVKQAGKDAK